MLSTSRKPTWAKRSSTAFHRSASINARLTRGCWRGSQRRASSSAASNAASSGVFIVVFDLDFHVALAHCHHIRIVRFNDRAIEYRLPARAGKIARLPLQGLSLSVSQQWQQLHPIGCLSKPTAQHQLLNGFLLGIVCRGRFPPALQLVDEVFQLLWHAQYLHFTCSSICRRGQSGGA